MMRKMYYVLVICIAFLSCKRNTEVPTQFSQDALNDTFLTLDGQSVSFKEILKSHQGEVVLIDIWASWCGDCVKGLPDVRALQNQYKTVAFLFLSLDRSVDKWKQGIDRFGVHGEHYYMQSGWDGPFGEFVDLDWIPRYMIIDKAGNIQLFKATEATDENIKHILNKYINQ